MRKIIITLLLSLLMHTASAYNIHAVNIDKKTVAAMNTAYAAEYGIESLSAESLDSIMENYATASIAMAGIYLSKKNDRKAMRNPGLLAAEENYYYKRIYSLVKDNIMPKFITVAYAMVKYPEDALQWGPYLFKTTTNVENLCKEFELLCTNGKLSFRDIKFLVINEQLEKLFNLAKLAEVDWKATFDKIGDFGKGLSKEDIKEDMSRLGNVLAQAGAQTVNSNLQKISKIGNIFHSSPEEVWKMYDQFRDTYQSIKNGANVKEVLFSVIGTPDIDGVAKLFQVDDYNITSYISNYIKNLQDQYYTQRWYIYVVEGGSDVLVDYIPKKGTPDKVYSDDGPKKVGVPPKGWEEWFQNGPIGHHGRGQENDVDICNDHLERNVPELLKRAQGMTGWNDTRKAQYEKDNPGHVITFTYTEYHEDRVNYKGHYSNHHRHDNYCFRAFGMKVQDDWSVNVELYEETFDSQDMDLDAFISKMKVKMSRMQMDADDDEKNPYHGKTFILKSDAPKYYEMADERKMAGCNMVSFIANCNDGAKLAEGNFSWKENGDQGKSLEDPKSKEFAMKATVTSGNEDKELLAKQKEYTGAITHLKEQISQKEKEMSELVDKIYAAKQANNKPLVADLQEKYDSLDSEVASLKVELTYYQDKLSELNNQLEDYYEDLEDGLDGAYRIPSNMTELQSMFHLQWQDEGEWVNGNDEYIFTRHAYSPSKKTIVTYTAALKLSRKPRYFLGIRIHRAILSVEFNLSSSGTSENVVETMELDMSKTEQQRAEEVNAKLKQLMADMPDCSISVKYEYSNASIDIEDDEDGIHLLWASDRLDVARHVEAELTKIYAQLVFIESVLSYRQSITDYLKNQILEVVKRGERGTIALYALEKWQEAGEKARKRNKPLVNNIEGGISRPDKQPRENFDSN